MRKITQAVSVFYSSTDDKLADERKRSVLKVLKRVETSRDVAIRMIYWKDNIPGGVADESGQARIDLEVYQSFEIYFGCMGPNFGKGTVKEFKNAIESHIKHRQPIEVLFGFDETKINPFEIPDNFHEVKAFRSDIQSSKKYGRSILYFCFEDIEKFEEQLFVNLDNAVRKATSRFSEGPPSFS